MTMESFPGGAPQDVYQAFEALAVGVVNTRGPQLTVTAANSYYRRMIGRDDLVGVALSELFPELEGQNLLEQFQAVQRTGVPMSVREWRLLLDLGDGLRDHYFSFDVVRSRTADGQIAGLEFVVTETSDQVLVRRAVMAETTQVKERLSRAHDVIEALQRQFLPAGLPVLPQARIAAGYLLADAGSSAGGDWFDAVPLSQGRVALVVGDVVGHGMAAAAAMGQLRAIVHDRLDESADLGAALGAAERLAQRVPQARSATICIGVLDPGSGRFDYCTAGHPPPVLLRADGAAELLAVTGTGPLGGHCGPGAGGPQVKTQSAQLEVGDVVLFYTDGIIERPGVEPAAALDDLIRVAAGVAAGRAPRSDLNSLTDRVCTQTLELLVRTSGHADDVTLLAAQRVPVGDPLELDLPADLDAIGVVRDQLDAWLRERGAGEDDVTLLCHVVGELVTNVAEHAYPQEGSQDGSQGSPDGTTAAGRLRVQAELEPDGRVLIQVSDRGRWLDRRPQSGRGLGLSIAADLADDLRIEFDQVGTRTTVRHRVRQAARLHTVAELSGGPRTPASQTPLPSLMLVLEQPDDPGPRIRVDGVVDATTADHLAVELRARTAGGTRPLTVDLTGVTLLASAGVAVLHEAQVRQIRDRSLTFHAPAGSPARRVLELTALVHSDRSP